MSSAEQRAPLRRRFGITLLAGIPGILALALHVFLTIDPASIPGGLSRSTVAVLSAVNSLLLLAVACLLGSYAAPRVGLRSYLVDRVTAGDPIWPRLREELPLSLALGLAGSIAVILLDVAMSPLVAPDVPPSALATTQPSMLDVLAYVPVRFLYGGVTEELLIRFGLMSALAFGGWFVTGRRGIGPSSRVMWAAIIASAVLFGVGHLPALAQTVGLTPALVARTVLLNAVAGVVFGWLYWRRSLEAAMVSHATFHVPIVALSLVQVALA